MSAAVREKRLFTALFVGMIALHVALLLSARLYPFTDIPDHLAAATIIRHTGEPSNRFAEYYRVDTFMKPNTFHVAFSSLAIFPSVELANRIFFALYAALLPLSVLAAIRKLGGNPWFAFLSFLLVYNYSVSWGFAGFALAIPLVIFFCTFFVLDARGAAGSPRIMGAAGALALLYFVHVLAAMFCLLVLALGAVVPARRAPVEPGESPRRARAARALGGVILAAIPLVVLVAAWWRSEARGYAGPGIFSFLRGYYGGAFIHAFTGRWSLLILDNYHLFNGAAGYAIAALFSLAVLGPAAALSFRRRPEAGGTQGAAVLPLGLGAVLCSVLLPNELPLQSILYERFSVFVFLALVIYCGARAHTVLRRAGVAALVAVSILHYALWANYIFDFNRENAGFDKAFLRPAASGKNLAGLIYDYTYRGRPIYLHFPSYYIVWEKGVATANVTDYRFGPVRRARLPGLPRYLEWVGKRDNYDGRYRDMDYILMRGTAPGSAAATSTGAPGSTAAAEEIPPEAMPGAGGFLGGFTVARTAGRWSLHERTAPPR
jgi:uncharacterized membrane protein YhaH (DUF805 family)